MSTYYVGPGGNDANSGTSWGNRKLTLNGAEDKPVAAGDIVYVAPGTYPEALTVDISGSAGNPITYIADVTGENTDGIGGRVRVTGTNDETTTSRSSAITTSTTRSYRTFRGFEFDAQSGVSVLLAANCDHWIIEDCVFMPTTGGNPSIQISGTGVGHTIRRCFFYFPNTQAAVQITHSTAVNDTGTLIENCVVYNAGGSLGIQIVRVGGITVKNCTIIGGNNGVRVSTALAAGQLVTVNNCILTELQTALVATTTAEFSEDYNNLFGNNTNRSNVTAGSNSVGYPPNFRSPNLKAGFALPIPLPALLAEASALLGKTGTGTSTDDFFGITRPATASKISWGAVQSASVLRDTGTVHGGSVSLKLSDAGERFLMRMPVGNVSTTISMYVQREANYAGTNPSMVIKQPGQSDRVTTDAGSASAWNALSDTFTPAASPPYVDVFLRSENTATSGSYGAYADDVLVTPNKGTGDFEKMVANNIWMDTYGSPNGGPLIEGRLVQS